MAPTTPVAQVRGQAKGDNSLQRSILRHATISGKRRKVAFISPSVDSVNRVTYEDSESSIDLEIEVGCLDFFLKI
jgi:hypothetical protein